MANNVKGLVSFQPKGTPKKRKEKRIYSFTKAERVIGAINRYNQLMDRVDRAEKNGQIDHANKLRSMAYQLTEKI